MGRMIRPNDPVTVTRSAWFAFFSASKTRIHIRYLKTRRSINRWICACVGHKAGQKVKMPDDREMTICKRCGFYQD